jgi:hypothetical protein
LGLSWQEAGQLNVAQAQGLLEVAQEQKGGRRSELHTSSQTLISLRQGRGLKTKRLAKRMKPRKAPTP